MVCLKIQLVAPGVAGGGQYIHYDMLILVAVGGGVSERRGF